MNYQQALNFLFTQLPMYQRKGKVAFKKDLTNIIALCKALGEPQSKFPTIHIAGTNGKGSTAHMLSAVLQAHGYKTGLYTSPHYQDFRERIKIDGKLMSKKAVVGFVEKNEALFQKIKPSFFEMTVALAFEYFAKQKVDVAVIETGLGGRLDSTNIITPLISIITNISLDHQNMLGPDLPSIAKEKAGIIKSNIPVIIGEEQRAISSVFLQKAKICNAPISFANRFYNTKLLHSKKGYTTFEVKRKGELVYPKLVLGTGGTYQAKNLRTVLRSLDVLEESWPGFKLKKSKIRKGLKEIVALSRFIGRWQKLAENPLVLADSAHNIGGLKLAMAQLKQEEFQTLHMVIGTVNDKSLDDILELFPKKAIYYFAKADIPRGLPAEQLKAKAAMAGLSGAAYDSVKAALKAAKLAASANDLIYIGGSCFVVAEVI